jgi:ribulose-phosphate 3-epimerase
VLREDMGYKYLIEVDGGIKHDTLPKVVRLGADLIVMGSAIMGAENPAEAFVDAMGRLGFHAD